MPNLQMSYTDYSKFLSNIELRDKCQKTEQKHSQCSHDDAAFALNTAKDRISNTLSDEDKKISSVYLKSKMNRALAFQKFLKSGGDMESYQKGYIEGIIDACMMLGI